MIRFSVRQAALTKEDLVHGVMEDPEAAAAAAMRADLASADPTILDSWDFDVFRFSHAQLAALLATMFMQLGLTQPRVRW